MPHLELDIALEDDERVTGVLRDEEGRDTPFVGWVGLLALLQAAVSS